MLDRSAIGIFLAGLAKGTKWKRPVSKVTAVTLAVKGVLSQEQLASFVASKKGFVSAVRAELAYLAVRGLLPDGHLAQYIAGDPGFIKAMGRACQKLMLECAMEGDYEEASRLSKLMPE